ncbi:MAG: hypothetical protein AAGG09_10980 [Pseudomonadota bacterium]
MNKNIVKRNDYALGAVVVAWLFATVGALSGAVMWDFNFSAMGGVWIFLFVAILIALLIGWRPANDPPGGKKAPTVPRHMTDASGSGASSAGASSGGSATAAAPSAAAPKAAAPSTPSSGTASAAAAAPAAASETAPESTPAAGTKPAGLDAPRAGKADDLKQIKGVGPALERLCNSLGFYHFDQIAKWTADEVAWVDENLEGFKGRVTRDDWVAQAKALAEGSSAEAS